MTEPKRWQKPIFIDPQRVRSDTVPPAEAPAAREIPLTAVTDIDDEVETSSATTPSLAPSGRAKGSRWRQLLAGTAGAVLVAAVGLELYRLLDWSFALHPLAGGLLSAVLLALLGGGALEVWRGLRGLRQLRQAERLQQRARELRSQNGQGQAGAFVHELERHYRGCPLQDDLAAALGQLDSAYSDAEVMRYLSRHGLEALDERARRVVQRYSVESGVLVALSPWASFDMLLVGWRNLRMLREVADIYGIAPGAAAQWGLLKRVLHNLAFAGLSELAVDAGTQALGSSLTTQLSARAGQGLGAGLFTARTGQQAIRLCRPLPLDGGEERLLKTVSSALLARLSARKGAADES